MAEAEQKKKKWRENPVVVAFTNPNGHSTHSFTNFMMTTIAKCTRADFNDEKHIHRFRSIFFFRCANWKPDKLMTAKTNRRAHMGNRRRNALQFSFHFFFQCSTRRGKELRRYATVSQTEHKFRDGFSVCRTRGNSANFSCVELAMNLSVQFSSN